MNRKHNTNIKNVFSQACVYHITLQGKNSIALVESIDDMQIRENRNGGISIVGWLPDQSALIGLIHTLHELHYGILSVRALVHEEQDY